MAAVAQTVTRRPEPTATGEAGAVATAPTERSAEELARAISVELRRVARKARIPRPVTSGGGGFRARSSDKIFRRLVIAGFLLLFILPSLLAVTYFGAIAKDQFVSEARFAVRTTSQNGLGALTGLGSLFDSSQNRDTQVVSDYIRSRAFLDELHQKFDLRKIFGPSGWDFVATLKPDATAEQLLEYWRGQVSVSIDRASGLITLKVRTFDPESSVALAETIVRSSETMVNRLTRRNERDAFDKAGEELARVRKMLEAAIVAQRDERNSLGILNVEVASRAYGELITSLRLQLAKVDEEIESISRNAKESPQLVGLRARSQTLRGQIDTYEARIAGGQIGQSEAAGRTPKDGTLASRAARLEEKELNVSIARTEYAAAMVSYESARLALERQQSYILTHVPPRLAEESLYPRRGLMSFAFVFGSFIVWATYVGIAILVRDNMA